MTSSLPLPTPPPDYPPPIEAFEYVCRLSELLMVLVSLEQVFTAGQKKGVEFVDGIVRAAYDAYLKCTDPSASEEELAAYRTRRDRLAAKSADGIIAQHTTLVYSLALIMACSIFELFLNHLLDVLMVKEPRVSGGRTMRLLDLYEVKNSAEIFARFREAEIKEFDRLGIKEKVRYFVKKCNMREEVLFSFTHCAEREREHARSLGQQFLYSTFENRNAVAHRAERPITELRDVARAVGFFQSLIRQFSICVGKKYGIRIIENAEEDAAWAFRAEIRGCFQSHPASEKKGR